MKISIVIPSFNGKEILKKSLPVVVRHSSKASIIVVDDGSDDGTLEFVREKFPQVQVVRNEQNLGFPKSVNRGVAASKKADYIVLLNNDVYPTANYLDDALRYFTDEKVFAVTFNEKHSSWPVTTWQQGKLYYTQGADKTAPVYSTWASGGSCMIRTKLWFELGGFNPVYSPGYWEDIDLGWRAWKAGFKIIWVPEARVIHKHESTFKKLNQSWLNLIKERNELLFLWQNITDLGFIASHLRFLLFHTLAHPGYVKVILATISKLGQAHLSRLQYRSDRQILELVNHRL